VPKIISYITRSFQTDDLSLRRQRFFLALSGFIMAAAWPPLPLGFLAFIALILPLDIISGLPFGKAFKKGYLFAFSYHFFALYWISWVTIPGTLAAMAIISLYNAFIFGLYASLYRRNTTLAMLAFPFLWVGMEYFRTLFQIAFPWANLSYTQWQYLPFLQICEFIGDAGITVIIVAVNILLWRVWRGHDRRRMALLAVLAGLLIVIPVIYGTFVLSEKYEEPGKPITVALLQGGLTIEEKWDPANKAYNVDLYDSLARASVPADLVVWPESSAPMYLLSNFFMTQKIANTARLIKRPMLVGTLDYTPLDSGNYLYYNAAIQFDADGSHRKPFHKNKLVPFAETVPYSEYVPWLANLSLGWSDFEHGSELGIYKNDFGTYGMLICYEIIFPEMIDRYMEQDVDFLVNITNDTWYGRSSGPYQHAVMAIFRAIENRVYIARVANSGFTYFVDRRGHMYNESRLFQKTIVKGEVYGDPPRTFFNRTGPLLGRFGLLSITVVWLILVALWVKRKFSS